MAEVKKININKTDEPTLIAEKLIDTEADTVIFSIPRFSRFGESLNNFKLIKREAEVLNKTVYIESVDDEVLSHAAKAGLQATNPFLKQRRQRISDIVPNNKNADAVSVRVQVEHAHPRVKDAPDTIETTVSETDYPQDEELPSRLGEPISARPNRFRLNRKRKLVLIGIALFIILLVYAGLTLLPRASATIVSEKENWTFQKGITVSNTATSADAEKLVIPGQVFIKRDAATMKFPATGKKFVERKATGELTIYNAHSSQSQSLVVNTRFETPSGIIFRLKSGVVVPGAKIENGRVIPSSITTTVTADRPGTEANLGPISKLTIPGFSNTDKFAGFYGELKQGATGGFVGETQVPTEQDLANAKKQSAQTIEQNLRRQLTALTPSEFKIIDGATKFTIFKQAVDASVDSQNNFTILTEAQVSALAFKEADVLIVIQQNLKKEKENESMIWDSTLEYGLLQLQNPTVGTMNLPVEYTATISPQINLTDLKARMQDKSEEELRSVIISLPGVENARVSLWPFWVRRVPDNPSRIKIVVE